MARIRVVIGSNEFEAEGDETFLKGLYADFKAVLAAVPPSLAPGSADGKRVKQPGADNDKPGSSRNDSTSKQGSGRKRRVGAITADRNLDLRQEGKQTFADFVATKQPATNNEKNLVSIYYLTEELGQTCGAPQVMSCYDDREWRIPADIKNSLQQTASTEGWIRTEDSNALTVTVKGINRIKYDMPTKKVEP